MKTIFRFLSLAIALTALGASAVFAQDACADVDGQTALYTKVTDNYRGKTVAEKQAAIDAGKQFLEKYGACEALKDQIDFVKPQIPRLEGLVKTQTYGEKMGPIFKRFDDGVKSQKYDDVYAAGKEVLAVEPDSLNQLVPMGVIGLYQSYTKNYKYNDDTIRYAQQALALLKSGKELPKKNDKGIPVAGVYGLTFTREDAISEMTYAIGY
ncbi:MAG TPA: hypothetical protein VK468_03085, partial [Pyrinomonadaceae bacterium]|nr:hypothetical protein [Pyrinomonadaceae bacterium]